MPKLDYHCLTEQFLEELPSCKSYVRSGRLNGNTKDFFSLSRSVNRIQMNTCNTTEDFFREYISDVYDAQYNKAAKASDVFSAASFQLEKRSFLFLISTSFKESKVCRCNYDYCNELQ